MEWITKIENNPNIRIISRYDPFNDKINLAGQVRYKSNWVDYTKSVEINNTGNVDDIVKAIDVVYETLLINCNNFDCLNKLFENIKMIGFTEIEDE